MGTSILFNLLLNFLYAIGGGLVCIPLCMYAYYVFDNRTPEIHFSKQLNADNRAVGMVVGGLLLGICICTGLVIGLGLN